MWKFYLMGMFMLSGCSHCTFNALMCDKIISDPTATLPQECEKYSEEDAAKALNKTKIKLQSKDDIIEFNKNKKEDNE